VAYNVWDVGSTSEVAATQKKSLECGPGADDGGLTTSPGVILAGVLPMPVTSVTRVREGTTQSAEAAETDGLEHACSEGGDAFHIQDVGRRIRGSGEARGSWRLQGREPRYCRDVDSSTEDRRQ
jgi:hypothetical protein